MGIADSLKQAVEAGDVPGVAATAATADGTIFEGAAGVLKSDSVIWIASMTKAITGAAAMQMVERGKFGLDTPAADIVPEIARKEVLVSIGADGTVKTRPATKADHAAPSADPHLGHGLRHLGCRHLSLRPGQGIRSSPTRWRC